MADDILSTLRNTTVNASDSDEDIMKEVVRMRTVMYLLIEISSAGVYLATP